VSSLVARRAAALLLLTLPLACAGIPAGQSAGHVRQSPASARQETGCGPASARANTRLSRPRSIVLDRGCNLFVADSLGYRVLKIDPSGSVRVVAGGGTENPDAGLPGVRSRLAAPQSLSTDAAGNVYIGTEDARVLRLATDGTLRTVAGTGSCGTGGAPSGPAAKAALCTPNGLATDGAGDLYVADSGNRYVARVTRDGRISTVAGIGERVSSGDGGPAALARIGDPLGIAVDATATVYLSDGYSSTVRKIAGGRISRFAGGGSASAPGRQRALSADIYPHGLAVDAGGNLFIADDLHNQVRKVTPDGMIETVAGTGLAGRSRDGGPAAAATLKFPQGVAVAADGDLYIADTGNDRVRRVTKDGSIFTVV
jgi:sugar lactone lactonase YvrE